MQCLPMALWSQMTVRLSLGIFVLKLFDKCTKRREKLPWTVQTLYRMQCASTPKS